MPLGTEFRQRMLKSSFAASAEPKGPHAKGGPSPIQTARQDNALYRSQIAYHGPIRALGAQRQPSHASSRATQPKALARATGGEKPRLIGALPTGPPPCRASSYLLREEDPGDAALSCHPRRADRDCPRTRGFRCGACAIFGGRLDRGHRNSRLRAADRRRDDGRRRARRGH